MENGTILNTDDQLGLTPYIAENHEISFGNTSNSTTKLPDVYQTSDLLEGALFIVSNGTYQIDNIQKYWQHPADLLTRTFDNVAKLIKDPVYFFHDLIKAYADLYNIGLHLIIHNNNKYHIIDKNNFHGPNEELYNHEKHAFIWCVADKNAYCPLYIKDINGCILTVFKTDEMFAWNFVEAFINQKNQELFNTNQNQAEQQLNALEADFSNMVVDAAPASLTNYSTALTTDQCQTASTGDLFVRQMLQQIDQLTNCLKPNLNNILLERKILDFNITNVDQLSVQDAASQIQQRLLFISNIVQMVVEQTPQNNDTTISTNIIDESNIGFVELNETNDFIQPPSTELSNTTPVLNITSAITLTQFQYDAPGIRIQPKKEWRYRNMKDLGKKRLPLLAGEGPQRTSMRVTVPQRGSHPMYLGVKTQTHDNQEHRSKILVLEHTNIDMNSFCKDNNLNRLQFDECNPMDRFDPVTRCVYLSISETEHDAEQKDVRIHMFNLYQSSLITREMIDTEQLRTCRLAFWLCIFEDGAYRPISAPSISELIEEN